MSYCIMAKADPQACGMPSIAPIQEWMQEHGILPRAIWGFRPRQCSNPYKPK
jgi:hypothetical protein